MLYKKVGRPFFFRMDPEKAHNLVIGGLDASGKVPGMTAVLRAVYGVGRRDELVQRILGVEFPNPVGLAAGLDKNGVAVPGFSAVGFGFMEVGTVTPRPQPGNDLPRLFRLPEDRALINRMGFNNAGAERMAEVLGRLRKHRIPVAVNIGKNKVTPNETAEEDYRECLRRLYPYGDFFVVNISSPNTPGLRSLQHGDDLRRLLSAVTAEMGVQQARHPGPEKPVFVKLAPDLTQDELEITMDTVLASGISGVIATNTTIARDGLAGRHARETGGLSGKPLTQRSTEIIRRIYGLADGKLPIIGCGGIFTAQDAYDKIRAGAVLVELYTSLIYEGPGLLRKINAGLAQLLRRDGFRHISQAVGVDAGR